MELIWGIVFWFNIGAGNVLMCIGGVFVIDVIVLYIVVCDIIFLFIR